MKCLKMSGISGSGKIFTDYLEHIYIYTTMGYFAVYYIVVKMLSCSLLMLFPGNFALFLVAFVLFAKKSNKKKAVKILNIMNIPRTFK